MKWAASTVQRVSLFLLLIMMLFLTDGEAQVFVPTGRMTMGRRGHSATLLQDGRVLIAGGGFFGVPGSLGAPSASSSAEIYDPDSGTFTETSEMSAPRNFHSAVLLLDGRVLIAGGCTGMCSSSAELYNPATGTFSRTGDMSIAQSVSAAVLLRSGKVLVIGYLTADLFDPASGTFVSVGSCPFICPFVTRASLLLDGTVLLNGGSLASIYDPVINQFRSLPLHLDLTESPAAPLFDGSVVFPGGYTASSYGDAAFTQNALYDPATQTFKVSGDMSLPRGSHTATLLKDGRLLIAGGYNGNFFDYPFIGTFDSAEMYDSATGKFSLLARPMVLHRYGHTATLLSDGRVLIAGGVTFAGNYPSRTEINSPQAEVFVPESTQGNTPRLSLDRTRYCAGDSWTLQADAVAPHSDVQISGTWDGSPWTIPNWKTSGQDGTLATSGTFGADTVGDYRVWLYAGGKVSNSVSIRIEDCIRR